MPFWTEALESVVAEHYPTEKAIDIAKRLGPEFTKNAVIGKAFRMGIVAQSRFGRLIPHRPLPEPAPSMTDDDFRGCRYINGKPQPLRPGMYCGKPCEPYCSYCAEHHALCWRPLGFSATPVKSSA
jgi:hypothetical protein